MLRRTTTAVLLALALIAAACATGGTPQAEGPSAAALTPTSVASSVATAQTGGDATSEGIQVHGHWTIEVRNPDGTLTDRREFDNALETSGGTALLELLTGNRSMNSSSPEWLIVFDGPGFITCGTTRDPGWRANHGGCATVGLVPATTAMSQTPATLTLAKHFTIDPSLITEDPASIADVETVIGGGIRKVFTAKTLATPVPIGANQTVYIEVEISFS